MDEESKRKIIESYMANPGVRSRLGASMAEPLRRNIDYQSVGRKTFLVDQIPGFHCSKCGLTHPDEKYVHSEEECVVAEVILT